MTAIFVPDVGNVPFKRYDVSDGLGWNYRRIGNTDSPYTATASDVIVGVFNSGAGAISVNLPAGAAAGRIILVKDESHNAAGASLHITVNAPSGGTLDGGSSQTLDHNGQAVAFYCAGSDVWFTWAGVAST